MRTDRSLLTYFLLSFITCGIYSIIFWYCYVEDLNTAFQGDGQESPNYIVVILLSLVTCGIYGIYWYYKQANRIQASGQQMYDLVIQENGTTVLLWMVIGYLTCGLATLYATYLMINNMNTVAAAYNSKGRPAY